MNLIVLENGQHSQVRSVYFWLTPLEVIHGN